LVLVSYRYNFIYLKSEKTAGTSVEMALEPLCIPPEATVTEVTKTRKTQYGIVGQRNRSKSPSQRKVKRHWYRTMEDYLSWRNHKTARAVRFGVGKRCWDRSTRIANIRNPFDKVISWYHFEHRHEGNVKNLDFSILRKNFLEQLKGGRFGGDRNIFFIGDNYVIDRIIRFEHLRDDLTALQRELELPIDPVAGLSHEKSMKESRRNYPVPDYFDREAIEIVKSNYDWVFDRFDYPTEPVDQNRRTDAPQPG